jgi:hypothetical protein
MTTLPNFAPGCGRFTLVRREIDGSERPLILNDRPLAYHTRPLAEQFAKGYGPDVSVRDREAANDPS